ncbi:MAG TPA: WYL domain-containing protein [Acidimicrobiales bacterium]|nr:WYL domain-containing protein [Acidimicrobiales bacterium]
MAEDRFERLANLVTFLLDAGERQGRGATYAEIVGGIPGYPEGEGARRRAFERDKKLLRDEDIPLVEEDGRYRIPPEDYYLPDLGLSEDEQLALQLAVAAVPLGEGGEEGLRKLTVGLGAGAVAPGAASALADLDEHPLLPMLHAAIRRRATVTFLRAGDARTVEPASLFFRDGHWYLFGFDRLRGADRNFRVDRLGDDVAVGSPAGFEARRAAPTDPDEMMPKPWLFGEDDVDERLEIATVRVDAVLAAKAVADAGESATVVRDVDGDGSVRLTMPVRERGNFRSWVLGMLDHAEVVGPPELRADVADWLRRFVG